jgi:hypothetical protein
MAHAVTLPGERLAGLSADLFHKLQVGNITLDEFALFTQRRNPFDGLFRLTVDYDQRLPAMIDDGHYDWVNGDIKEARFLIKGKGSIEFESRYFYFNRDMTSEGVINDMKSEGWEPAKVEHLLSFRVKYPKEQLKFSIIALGSSILIRDSYTVPVLNTTKHAYGLNCNLDFLWFGLSWASGWNSRFLAVRR